MLDTDSGVQAIQLDSLELATEARLVGLRALDPPTLEDVERRRLQLWLLSLVILLGVTAVMMLASTWPQVADRIGIDSTWLTPAKLRGLMMALTVAFSSVSWCAPTGMSRRSKSIGWWPESGAPALVWR